MGRQSSPWVKSLPVQAHGRIIAGMKVYRARRASDSPSCALTIGNFDGVHRGHQAMLALLVNEARHRGLPACVMTFEPNPRDFFAVRTGQADRAPAWPCPDHAERSRPPNRRCPDR